MDKYFDSVTGKSFPDDTEMNIEPKYMKIQLTNTEVIQALKEYAADNTSQSGITLSVDQACEEILYFFLIAQLDRS